MDLRKAPAWSTVAVLGAVGALWGCQSGPTTTAKGPLIQAPSVCTDFNFRIYFEPKSDVVTPQADKLIGAAQHRARNCDVTGVVVVGLADAAGDPNANLELSKRRADAVTDAMHRHGFNSVEFHIAAVGQTGATDESGDSRPVRRRADVSIHLADRPPTSH